MTHSTESAHQLSFRPDCNNTAEVPSLLCALLSQQSHLSLICVVVGRAMIPGEIFTSFAEISKELSVCMSLGFLSGSKNFACFSGFPTKVLVLHGYAWDPLSGQVLHHDCISVIVSRFAIVNKNLVTTCYRNESKHCVYTNPHVSRMWALKILHAKNWRVSLRRLEFHHPPNVPRISCSHSGISEYNGAPRSIGVSFLFVIGGLLAWVSSGRPDLCRIS